MKTKRTKISVSVALALVLVMALAGSALADEPDTAGEWRDFDQCQNGDYGYDVAAAQTVLYKLNYGINVDRDFGPATETKVKAYQSNAGLSSDGIVGPNTWGNMQSAWLHHAYEDGSYNYYRINYVSGYTFRRGKASERWYVAYPVNQSSFYIIPLEN